MFGCLVDVYLQCYGVDFDYVEFVDEWKEELCVGGDGE